MDNSVVIVGGVDRIKVEEGISGINCSEKKKNILFTKPKKE